MLARFLALGLGAARDAGDSGDRCGGRDSPKLYSFPHRGMAGRGARFLRCGGASGDHLLPVAASFQSRSRPRRTGRAFVITIAFVVIASTAKSPALASARTGPMLWIPHRDGKPVEPCVYSSFLSSFAACCASI